MNDSNSSLDYGEQLVMRYRASGLTRKGFAARSGVSVSTLDYYVRRERKASLSVAFASSRILPVEFVASEGATLQAGAPAAPAGIRIRLADGRALEIERGFDAGLLLEVLTVLEENARGERAQMFALGPATKVYVATGATDMRKGFDGLFGLVRDELLCDPLSGHLFLFANAARTRLKLLFWDASGLWVCAKRLEKGRFHWPEAAPGTKSVKLRAEELAMLVGGIDLKRTQPRRGWYRLERAG